MRILRVLVVFLSLLVFVVSPALAQDTTAHIRVANYSPDAPPLDLYVDGQRQPLPSLNPGAISPWLPLAPGAHQIAFASGSGDSLATVVGPFNVTLPPGSFSLLPVLGTGDNIYAIWVIDATPAPAEDGMARITTFNGLPGTPPLEIRRADGELVVQGVTFGRAVLFNLPAGPVNLRLIDPTTPDRPLRTGNTDLRSGMNYILGAIPGRSGSGVLLLPVPPDLALLPGQTAVSSPPPTPAPSAQEVTASPVPTPTAAPAPTTAPPAQTPPDVTGSASASVLDLVLNDPQFSIAARAIVTGGVEDRLRDAEKVTLLVPTDQAWRNLLAENADLLATNDTVQALLLYHIVEDRVPTRFIFDQMELLTAHGAQIRFTKSADAIVLDDRARILTADVEAANGLIHVVDAVLIPPELR